MVTLDELRQSFPRKHEEKFCREELKPALSSIDVTNESFLSCVDSPNKEFCIDHHGCDMKRVTSFYDFLRNKCKDSTCIQRAVKEASQELISSLQRPASVKSLRLYLMLPFCHLMQDPHLYQTINIPFAKSMKDLDENHQEILDEWFKSLPDEYFKRYVKIFRLTVESRSAELLRTYGQPESMKDGIESKGNELLTVKQSERIKKRRETPTAEIIAILEPCIWLLEKLYKINEKRQQILPNSFFIVSNLLKNEKDIERDFRRSQEQNEFCLCKFPFLYNVESKFILLKLYNKSSRPSTITNQGPKLQVRRSCIIKDTFSQLGNLYFNDKDVHKKNIYIIFDEEDDDGPGVVREFYTVLFRELLKPSFGLFSFGEHSGLLKIKRKGKHLQLQDEVKDIELHFCFVGYMLGLLVFNSENVDFPFPLSLFKKLLDKSVDFNDLLQAEPEVAKDLKNILDKGVDQVERRTFVVRVLDNETEVTIDLCENGSQIPLTDGNKQEYVNLMVDFYLNRYTEKEFDCFKKGFNKSFSTETLKRFCVQPSELRSFIIGKEKVNFSEEEKNARYMENYNASKTIRILWKLLHEMSEKEKRQFLQFMTGCERIPISGFPDDQPITITPLVIKGEITRNLYPRATTCFNTLHLPDIPEEERLKDRLFGAVFDSDYGFTSIWTPKVLRDPISLNLKEILMNSIQNLVGYN